MQNPLLKLIGGRARRRLGSVALVTFATLALAAPALAAHFRFTVRIANHRPVAGRRWPIALRITDGRRRLSGTVRYQFLFSGVVVRTQPQHGAFKFRRGVYRDELVFPAQSIGQPLTLRFLVRTRHRTEHADWKVDVRR